MTNPRLLATDLDGTFIGDDAAMHALWSELEEAGIIVAFSTGRHLPSIEEFYAEQKTSRRADVCVCMVGTEIWHRGDAGYVRDDTWSAHISEAWDRDRVAAIVAEVPAATPQDDEWQSDFKSSWYLEVGAAAGLAHIEGRLSEEGLEAKVVYSVGRFLDLLPARSGKGEAVRYAAEHLGVSSDAVVTCGDSGNDLDMMRPELGFRSIAVGNATPELASFSAPNVYHASTHYAGGIREGLLRYGWIDGRSPPIGRQRDKA
jgi:sucrose-6F-phosphate phosphohydrolase